MLETVSSTDGYKAVGAASNTINNVSISMHLWDTMLLIPTALTLNLYQD